jgi:hypothetical protein
VQLEDEAGLGLDLVGILVALRERVGLDLVAADFLGQRFEILGRRDDLERRRVRRRRRTARRRAEWAERA